MSKILNSNIKVGEININTNGGSKDGIADILNNWGSTFPVIKINDYVLSAGEIQSFDLSIKINSLPSFSLTINDNNYFVRSALKDRLIDEGVIFIGFANWYIKFNAIITITNSTEGGTMIDVNGLLYNQKLYETWQFGYSKKTFTEIITDICKRSKMGLFTVNGSEFNSIIDNTMNTGKSSLDYFRYIIETYTNALWSVDPFYNFHIVDIDKLRLTKLDKYTIIEDSTNKNKFKIAEPNDMILTANSLEDVSLSKKLKVRNFTINTNWGGIHINTAQNYNVFYDKKASKLISDDKIGIGSIDNNSFYGFNGQFFPQYNARINKLIAGKVITATMENIIFELTPFSVVNFEAWLPKQGDKPPGIDIENSGKKIVIGYNFGFNKQSRTNTYPAIVQKIDLI